MKTGPVGPVFIPAWTMGLCRERPAWRQRYSWQCGETTLDGGAGAQSLEPGIEAFVAGIEETGTHDRDIPAEEADIDDGQLIAKKEWLVTQEATKQRVDDFALILIALDGITRQED